MLSCHKIKLLSATILASVILVPANAAFAQSSPDTSIDDEIIVTARIREESLQEVPLSITAISEAELRNANVAGLEDIADLTPGVTFQSLGSFSEIIVRGLAQTVQGSVQGNVGVFVDGVFLNSRSSLEFGNMDLGQIEILKGPQSALFGRNTFAGAINYISNAPDLGEFNGYVEGEVGSDERLGLKGSINLPVGDNIAVRVFGGTSKFDGTIENIRGGENLGGWDERTTYGASILFEPNDKMRFKIFGVRNDIEEDQPALRNFPFGANNGGTQFTVPDGMGGTRTLFSLTEGEFDATGTVDLDPRGFGNTGRLELGYINADFDLDFATLTANFNTSKSEYATFFDNIGDSNAINQPFFPPFPFSAQLFTNTSGDASNQDALDVRLVSKDDSAFSWLIGGSYTDASTGFTIASDSALLTDSSELAQLTVVPELLDQEIAAVYGAVDFAVSDRVTVGGELRYTDENQVLDFETQILFFPALSTPPDTREAEFDFWSGKAFVDYQISPETLLYAYAARGIKSGGINKTSPSADFQTFEPEGNWTYEAGIKTDLWGGRARVNAAAYLVDWSDVQTRTPPSISSASVIFNNGGAKSIGIEIDANVDVTENFNLRMATTFLDPQYDDGFVDQSLAPSCTAVNTATITTVSACSADVGGNQIARTSNFQFFGSGTYTQPSLFGDFDGFLRADFTHEAGRSPLSINLTDTGDNSRVNLRAGLRSDNTEFSLWMDNAFDEDYIARITPSTDTGGSRVCRGCGLLNYRVFPGNGRTFGAKLRQTF